MPPRSLHDPIHLLTLPRVMTFVGALALATGLGLARRNLTLLGGGLLTTLVVAHLSAPPLRRLRIEREHLPNIFEGERLRVKLTFTPTSRRDTMRLLEITDTFPAGERRQIRAFLPRAFAGGQKLHLRYHPRVEGRRGLYVLGPLELAAADPLGLVQTSFTASVFSELMVYPTAAILQHYRPLDTYTLRHVGERALPLPGLSQEFLHVREYRHGDSPRLVHWPMSLRQGKLCVKALEENTMTELAIVLDLFQISHTGIGNLTSTEALIAAAASLATHAIENCHLVRLVTLGQESQHLPPGGSQEHLFSILRMLTLARAQGSGSFAAAARRELAVLPAGGTVVFILAATSVEPALGELIADLQGAGRRISAVLIDDRSFPTIFMAQQQRALGSEPTDAIARRLADLGVDLTVLARGDTVREKLEMTA